eukprot:TRINITY_DN6734_c0_g2_i1.p1 TRINITY_DN6734_c0_g2~~TRINITY_DN6734_c0_g2_i1.p1  ORF type:complete len:405 (-),score=109.43 TRINITY_DN6734_c0_g2_i1:443-1657(-)
MLRGNHECRHLTEYFTFKEECIHKFDIDVYNTFMEVFDALPLVAIMNGQFFCVHGGISPEIETLQDVSKIDRFTEPPSHGPMCDLLWSDPIDLDRFVPEFEDHFIPNRVRGCSYNYGYNAVSSFLDKNNLLSVIRAHEAQDSGYRMYRKNEATGFPVLITLFSAPNYLDTYGNRGAVMRYENNIMNIRQFHYTPHPYVLPGFLNGISWSVPFLAEKMREFLGILVDMIDDEQVEADEEEKARKGQVLKDRIKTVSRMLTLMKEIREEKEAAKVRLINDTAAAATTDVSTNKSPTDSLRSSQSEERLTNLGSSLHQSSGGVKFSDFINECRPPGIEKVLSESSKLSTSADSLRRKQSRERIISLRASQEMLVDTTKLHQPHTTHTHTPTNTTTTTTSPPVIKEVN